MHNIIGSDYHCGNGITTYGMLSSASVHETYQTLINEVMSILMKDVNNRDLDSCEVDEFVILIYQKFARTFLIKLKYLNLNRGLHKSQVQIQAQAQTDFSVWFTQ